MSKHLKIFSAPHDRYVSNCTYCGFSFLLTSFTIWARLKAKLTGKGDTEGLVGPLIKAPRSRSERQLDLHPGGSWCLQHWAAQHFYQEFKISIQVGYLVLCLEVPFYPTKSYFTKKLLAMNTKLFLDISLENTMNSEWLMLLGNSRLAMSTSMLQTLCRSRVAHKRQVWGVFQIPCLNFWAQKDRKQEHKPSLLVWVKIVLSEGLGMAWGMSDLRDSPFLGRAWERRWFLSRCRRAGSIWGS